MSDEPAVLEPEAWELDALADAVAEHRLATKPVLDGILTGLGTALGVSAPIWLYAAIVVVIIPSEHAWTAIAATSATLLTAIATSTALGVVFGALDAPGRLGVALARRDSPLALLLMSQVAGLFLGGLWIGTAGAAGGLVGGALGLLFWGGNEGPAVLLMIGLAGWFWGVFFGAPATLMHATARGLTVNFRAPWGVGPFAATATAFGAPVEPLV